MKKFIIGIISYAKNPDRVKNALKLFNQLKDYPKLIIAQGYKPKKTNNEDIIIYEQKALGICNARKRLQEEFMNTDYTHILLLDDDITIYKFFDNHGEITNYNYIAQDNFTLNNCVLSREVIKKIPFEENLIPAEDYNYRKKIDKYFVRENCKLLFFILQNHTNSTWRKNNG